MRVIAAILLLSIPCFPVQIDLQWDRGAGGPDPDGYGVFHKSYQRPYDFAAPLWLGVGTHANVTVPDDRQTAIVVRAYIDGVLDLDGHTEKIWSESSNEIIYTPAVTPPEKPRSLIVRVLMAVVNFFKGLFA